MSLSLQFAEWVERLPFRADVRPLASGGDAFFAVNKPAGVRSHPNQSGRIDSGALLAAPYSLEDECFILPDGGNGVTRVHLINRLDGPTSGLVLLAVDAGAAAALRELFRQRTVTKIYQAVVFGLPRPPAGRWSDPIAKRREGGAVRVETGQGDGGMPAVTRYRIQSTVRRGASVLSRLELQPETGRTHQLRIHCAAHGVPIVGDQTYGDFKANRACFDAPEGEGTGERCPARLYLHAARLAFSLPWRGQICEFEAEAPLPPEFHRLLGADAPGKRTAGRRFRRP